MGCWYSTSCSAECTPSCCITFICKSSYSALRDSLYHLPFTDAQLSSPQVSGWPLKALFKNECDVSPSAPVVPRHFNSYCGIVLNRSAVSSLCSLRVLKWKCLLLVIATVIFIALSPDLLYWHFNFGQFLKPIACGASYRCGAEWPTLKWMNESWPSHADHVVLFAPCKRVTKQWQGWTSVSTWVSAMVPALCTYKITESCSRKGHTGIIKTSSRLHTALP